VHRAGERISQFRTRKTAALFAYLSYAPERRHSRDQLIELFWPDHGLDSGRNSLSTALSSLRHQFRSDELRDRLFLADRHTVALCGAQITTDVERFESALRKSEKTDQAGGYLQGLMAAVDAYGGELLPGWYESWIPAEQERLAGLFFSAVDHLIRQLVAAGDVPGALRYAQLAVRMDPLREDAHCAVMRLYGDAGMPAAGLRQYHQLQRMLRQELDAAPGRQAVEIAGALQQQAERPSAVLIGRGSGPAVSGVPWELLRSGPPTAGEGAVEAAAGGGGRELFPELEAPEGAVRIDSAFYILRPADDRFRSAVARRDGVVLLKGSRQIGKTSLLARGLQHAREAGARVALTDLQALDLAHLESQDALCLTLATWLREQLGLAQSPTETWDPNLGAGLNLRRYLRRVVLAPETPLVWAVDEADRLFTCPFGSQVFALFRSWYNERALEPDGPMRRLTQVIAYATEAHLFVSDLNQSPFNVGTRVALDDFSLEQVAELNRRHGSPLRSHGELRRFHHLAGGHPYLVRRGLFALVDQELTLDRLEAGVEKDGGVWSDHLRRMYLALQRDPEQWEALQLLLRGHPLPSDNTFYRLRSAGLILGDSTHSAQLRCSIYSRFLARRLSANGGSSTRLR